MDKDKKSVLEARKISKVYGKKANRFVALKDIDLKIERGESVAIIGKSGSGKTTLMHILALLDSPTTGEMVVGGEKSTKLKKAKLGRLRNREFGFVFQQFFMNPNDSVLNNVMLPLKIAGISAREQKRRAMEALKAVELEEKAKNKANDLSGGQKQRVCIARALVNNPKVIFADEPTGNLDSQTGDKVEKLLSKLNKEQGITLVVVTHDEDLARRCNRQIYLKDGQIIRDERKKKTGGAR
ncbi:ABC transporter ATP-binding protein [Candidatus Saccharibacteria bacterium]|nr:ABC transporter ATP-binding protein [Candidatus Saccharibacteria bacterium]